MENISQACMEALEKAKQNNGNVNLKEVIREVVREQIEIGINNLLNNELTAFLGYEKNEQGESQSLGNARNGNYDRMLQTGYGIIKINMPRDRNGEQLIIFLKWCLNFIQPV